jgi:toxin ParE1/3/4
MSPSTGRWRVILSDAAETDLEAILEWTAEHFGVKQAATYAEILISAVDALEEGPSVIGIRARRDLGNGVLTLHAARNHRRARHLLVFQAFNESRTMRISRILHDSMDIARHLPEVPEGTD